MGVLFIQEILRKHAHILYKRTLATDYVVADLDAPEWENGGGHRIRGRDLENARSSGATSSATASASSPLWTALIGTPDAVYFTGDDASSGSDEGRHDDERGPLTKPKAVPSGLMLRTNATSGDGSVVGPAAAMLPQSYAPSAPPLPSSINSRY